MNVDTSTMLRWIANCRMAKPPGICRTRVHVAPGIPNETCQIPTSNTLLIALDIQRKTEADQNLQVGIPSATPG